MPAHHLTPDPQALAEHVLAVLAGADPTGIAARAGLSRTELHDAVELFRNAGLDALQHQREHGRCYSIHIELTDWEHAETTARTHLAPTLTALTTAGAIHGWWFLRKHPCWRLRFHHPDHDAVDDAMTQLARDNAIRTWTPSWYEPETAAFGGPTALDTVHRHFRADSHGVLTYLTTSTPPLGRRELSTLLLTELLRAAGLDTFERADVYHRVTQLRPTSAGAEQHITDLAEQLRTLLAVPTSPESPLLQPGGPLATAAPWFQAHRSTGEQLRAHATNGTLTRGIRRILTHLVIFHWNRLGITTTQQALLAHAAQHALLPTI